MFKYLTSLFLSLMAFSAFSQYQEKNAIGLELFKPIGLLVLSANEKSSDFINKTLELSYRRKIDNYLSYRGTFGYVEYQDENFRYQTEYHCEGYFTKQGIDINFNGEEESIAFLLGLSFYLGYQNEKQRTKFDGGYYPDFYGPFRTQESLLKGGEFAQRFLFNFNKMISLELTTRVSGIYGYNGRRFNNQYFAGMGFKISRKVYLFSGIETKLFLRF